MSSKLFTGYMRSIYIHQNLYDMWF